MELTLTIPFSVSLEPNSLQSLCRSKVRNILRKNISKEHPDAVKRPRHTKKPKRKLRRMAVPIFDEYDSSDEERFFFGNGRGNFRIYLNIGLLLCNISKNKFSTIDLILNLK